MALASTRPRAGLWCGADGGATGECDELVGLQCVGMPTSPGLSTFPQVARCSSVSAIRSMPLAPASQFTGVPIHASLVISFAKPSSLRNAF